MRCDYCGVEQRDVLGTTRTHCAPPFERQRHRFTGKHPADMAEAVERLTYASKRKSYDAGVHAKATGGSRDRVVNGWGHRKSAYSEWYLDGFDGKPFAAIRGAEPEPYAVTKARKLISDAYAEAGRHAYAEKYLDPEYRTTALFAFARYIESVE